MKDNLAVLTANELMVEGEKLLGNYNIEIARFRNDRWTSTVPPLFAIVTNQRLILQPHARKRHEPAIIPGKYIAKVIDMDVEQRHIVNLTIKTGHQINMFIAGPQSEELAGHLRTLARRRGPTKIESPLDLEAIQKMIAFFDNWK